MSLREIRINPSISILTLLSLSFAASEHSLVLKEIKVPLWSHNTCDFALQAQFGPAYHLPSTAVCAGAEGRDACDVSWSPQTLFVPYSRTSCKYICFCEIMQVHSSCSKSNAEEAL